MILCSIKSTSLDQILMMVCYIMNRPKKNLPKENTDRLIWDCSDVKKFYLIWQATYRQIPQNNKKRQSWVNVKCPYF